MINLAFDYVLQPRVMSTTLELSPVVTIATILVWTALIGPAGALLAVPLTITVRALLLPFPGAAWFVAFLGREAVSAASPTEARPGGRPSRRPYNRGVIRGVIHRWASPARRRP